MFVRVDTLVKEDGSWGCVWLNTDRIVMVEAVDYRHAPAQDFCPRCRVHLAGAPPLLLDQWAESIIEAIRAEAPDAVHA